MKPLKKHDEMIKRPGPLVVVVMDGVGLRKEEEGNAVRQARTPVLDHLFATCPHMSLKAHGTAVGLPSDADMGNSEVGHNAIGAGRVFKQGAKLVNSAIEQGTLWQGEVWKKLIGTCDEKKSTLHFIGLFSDGNVHSHIDHLRAMIRRAADEGVGRVRIHILLDGRDVGERTALDYVLPFEEFLGTIRNSGCDALIASGGGRMNVTMDRYEADWSIVERGWKAHVLGEAAMYPSAEEAIRRIRESDTSLTDQFMPPFVIEKDGKPAGTIEDGDAVIFFNFRGDRAIEISRAFEDDDFNKFDRKRRPAVEYAGMMEYDGDLHIPKQYLVSPPAISGTMGELLAGAGVTQLAISETQKFGHVTYFWNGNRSGTFNEKLETYIEIPSDRVPFEQRPWMKSAEITDRVIEEIKTGGYGFIRLNYPNGDMVGHTGVMRSAVMGVEAVDLALGRLLRAVEAAGGIALITADHGNADEMYELDKQGNVKRDENGVIKSRTSHTLNPVPFIMFDPLYNNEYTPADVSGAGLSNIAATCLVLLNYTPPEAYDRPLIDLNKRKR
ncbi:2,3-bisphosphoglycerate-independent phosphoglycerate mutase [bacterium]|nr:2,3-bisphosphoglycerate-independent phosphoglycerate mutase [bacterium]